MSGSLGGALTNDTNSIMLSDVCPSVAYMAPNGVKKRARKNGIGIEVAHVTRDSDTNLKVKREGVRGGAYCGGLPLFLQLLLLCSRL